MPVPYVERMGFKKMPIEDAIKLLIDARDSFEFAVVTLHNKPYRQWQKEQKEAEDADMA